MASGGSGRGDGSEGEVALNIFDVASAKAQFLDDFLSGDTFGVTFGQNNWALDTANGGGASSGGDGAGALGDSNVAGYVILFTGGDPSGEAGIATAEQQFKLTGGVVTWQARVFIPILSTLAEEYSLYVGIARFLGTGSIGVSFIYNRLVSPNWIMVTDSGGGGTQTPTAVPVVAGAWITLKAVVNATGTSVEYFINTVSVGTLATNIPSATDYLTPNMSIIKSAGGTSRKFFVDYFGLQIIFTAAR